MARGNWRNWEEVECPKCHARLYKKYMKRYKKCLVCGEELKEPDQAERARKEKEKNDSGRV